MRKRFFHYTAKKLPIISAHRGGDWKGYAENSIPALEHTLRFTPAMFEIDPHLTSDHVAVLMHDATLERTTNGHGKVADTTLHEVQALNLKDAMGNILSDHPPTLGQAIEWSQGKSILNLDIEDVPP